MGISWANFDCNGDVECAGEGETWPRSQSALRNRCWSCPSAFVAAYRARRSKLEANWTMMPMY